MSHDSPVSYADQLRYAANAAQSNALCVRYTALAEHDEELSRIAEKMKAAADRLSEYAESYAPIDLFPVAVVEPAPEPYAPHTSPIPYVLTDEVHPLSDEEITAIIDRDECDETTDDYFRDTLGVASHFYCYRRIDGLCQVQCADTREPLTVFTTMGRALAVMRVFQRRSRTVRGVA